jgi:hypothetical protein
MGTTMSYDKIVIHSRRSLSVAHTSSNKEHLLSSKPAKRVFVKTDAVDQFPVEEEPTSLEAQNLLSRSKHSDHSASPFSHLLFLDKEHSPVEKLLHAKLLSPDIFLSLLGTAGIAAKVELPEEVVEAALMRGVATRWRLCCMVLQSLNLDPNVLERNAHDLPSSREILAGAVLRFILTAALSGYRGVLENHQLAALKQAFGEANLQFALLASPSLRRQNWRPALPLKAEPLAIEALPAFLAAMEVKNPELSVMFAAILGAEADSKSDIMRHPAAGDAALSSLRHAMLPEGQEIEKEEEETLSLIQNDENSDDKEIATS